jgi:TolB-like protein
LLQNVAEMDRHPPSVTYKFGSFALDPEAGMLFRGGEPALLGQRAIALLRLLLERPASLVSKDALIEAAWSGLAVEDSNLTVQIAALRRVLEQDGGAGWIETLPRRGYRYVGPPVVRVDETPPAPALPVPEKPSIAVLPFEHSGDAAWLAEGTVDDIITGLSRIKWLFVIARNSSFLYRDRAVDVKQVGRELGVRYVLQGSVRRSDNRVRINAQLADSTSGAQVWAERYDRVLDDVFALQDEIALAVVGAIEPSLRRAEVERIRRKRPDRLDAYELLLRAQPDVESGMPDRAAAALPLLMRTLALDPAYALAHGLAAMAHHNRFLRAGLRRRIVWPRSVTRAWRWSTAATMRWRSPSQASRSAWMRTTGPPPSPHSRLRSRSAHRLRSPSFSAASFIAGPRKRSRRSHGPSARCGCRRSTPGRSPHSAHRRSGIFCWSGRTRLRRRLTRRCSPTPATA